ncbi:hypothetical protein LIER_24927 [Lithospermum erythrorhizon]|uniref:F-box domain-containing protein n=1 Tax=Lithospermum erythrorhizon TaxID=34254 RepID=A0AAV3R635_LITER
MSTNIPPEDIILQILLSLPVKSLLRFRSVCKSFLNLISHPHFILNYRNKVLIKSENQPNYIVSGQGCVYELNVNGVNELRVPCDRVTNVVGVCNGIVCLESNSSVILWNPATRAFKESYCPELNVIMPLVEGTEDRVCIGRSSYGFGLDANGADYICLAVYCRRWDLTLHSVVRVYSSRTDSWKVLEGDFCFQMTEYKNCAVVKGVPYWTAIVRKLEDDEELSEVFLWFDARHEVFMVVEYPEVAFKRGNRAYFMECDDRLVSLTYCPGEQCDQLVDVWVLDDGECWSKKHTVGPILVEIERLVGCTRDGDILGLDTKRGLFLFLSRNKEIRYIHTDDGTYGDIDVHNYYETLTSVDEMKNIDEED